jgi:hypothetical protein
VDITQDAPAPLWTDDFAAWVRLAVKYAGHTSAMPLLRLDRHGLTVAVHDDADAPVIGLPQRAAIIGDATPLCELRLVARSIEREEGRPATAILEPSRADDHASLWQTLRAYRAQLGAAPSGEQPAPLPGPDSSAPEWRYRASCDAAFTLANHDDACFFSRWLDYHFAELRARARMNDVGGDLREIFMRVADQEVDVRFVFHAGARAVRTSSELACRWIAEQAEHQLGMTVEHWVPGTMPTRSTAAHLNLGRKPSSGLRPRGRQA